MRTGDAIGTRGKRFKSYTVKDRKKDLEEFQKTGIHPDIEAARKRAQAETLLALPDPDASRPRTYIEFAIDKTVIGELPCASTPACLPDSVAPPLSIANLHGSCYMCPMVSSCWAGMNTAQDCCTLRLNAGRVVFEVFQDVTPIPARTFVNRCRSGTTATLQGSQVGCVCGHGDCSRAPPAME
jgi:hypothetical protein